MSARRGNPRQAPTSLSIVRSERPGPGRSVLQRERGHRWFAETTPFLLVGILLMSGAAALGAAPGASSDPTARGDSQAALAPAVLLQHAHDSAARGAGPWGPVSAGPARVPLTGGPNLTFGVTMAYDAADGYVVAVSLNATAGPYNNSYAPHDLTWKFAAGNWSLVTTVGQVPATLSPGLVYDAHDGYVLLYGGRLMDTASSVAPVTNQTWSYHAGVWTNLSANSTAAPFAVDFANLVYDAADEYVLLYNEIGITPTNPNGYLNTTWTYVGGVWTNITGSAGTPPAMLGAMAYDAADRYVLYFGGYTWSNQLTNATWAFHGGTWTNLSGSVSGAPSPRMSFGIDYDTARGSVVLYGGIDRLSAYNLSEFSFETWAYANGTWTRLSTNGTVWSIQTMTYDVADSESVLLGSNSSLLSPPNVVTWVFSGGSWIVAAPLFLHSQWSADVGYPLELTVTQSPNAGGLTYRYTGLPPGCAGANGPTVACLPTTAGTYSVSVSVSGSAGFQASARATVVVDPAPTVVAFTSTGPVGEVGIATQFQVSASFGTGPLSYSYAGLPAGCFSANSSQLECVPAAAGSDNVTAEITDSLGATASASTVLSVHPALALGGFAVNRTALDIGEPVAMVATLLGGVGVVSYAYSGLPAGCLSTDSSSLLCRPATAGTFSVAVTASDALGAMARGSGGFEVNPLPSITAVSASNTTIHAGGSVTVSATFSGGTAPYVYQYSGLPSGCIAPNAPSVTCSSVVAGNYSIGVTVVDSTGASTSGAASVVVLMAPHPIQVSPSAQPGAGAEFWSGFAVAAAAIGIAGVLGARRVYLTRQGASIVRELEAPPVPPTTGLPDAATASEEPLGPGQ